MPVSRAVLKGKMPFLEYFQTENRAHFGQLRYKFENFPKNSWSFPNYAEIRPVPWHGTEGGTRGEGVPANAKYCHEDQLLFI